MDKSYILIGGVNDELSMLINDSVNTVIVPYFPDLIGDLCPSNKSAYQETETHTYTRRSIVIDGLESSCFVSDHISDSDAFKIALDRSL